MICPLIVQLDFSRGKKYFANRAVIDSFIDAEFLQMRLWSTAALQMNI